MPEKFILIPSKGKNDPQLPENIILVPDSSMLKLFSPSGKASISRFGSDGRISVSFLSEDKIDTAVIGNLVGAPAAVAALEKIIVCGGKRIIYFGSCGAVSPELSIGDIFLPVSGISEEGTSHLYINSNEIPPPSKALAGLLENALIKEKAEYRKGKIWTTDAPYMETGEKVKKYSSLGAMAVDMEFTALCTVAEYRQVQFVSLMIVSDVVYEKKWRQGFDSEKFKRQKKVAVKVINRILGKNTKF